MENLVALGGGDEPEMCLSAIQVTLTNSKWSDAMTRTCSSTIPHLVCRWRSRTVRPCPRSLCSLMPPRKTLICSKQSRPWHLKNRARLVSIFCFFNTFYDVFKPMTWLIKPVIATQQGIKSTKCQIEQTKELFHISVHLSVFAPTLMLSCTSHHRINATVDCWSIHVHVDVSIIFFCLVLKQFAFWRFL